MSFSKHVSEWIYRYIKPLFFVIVLSGVTAFSGVIHIEFNSDFRAFFPKESPLITTFDDILEQYEQGETLVLYLKQSNNKVITPNYINTIQSADALVNTLPYVRYVRSLTSFQKPFPEEDFINNKFLGDWAQEAGGLKGVNDYIEIQAQLRGRLIADNGTGVIVLAQVDLPEPRYQSVTELMNAAEEIAIKLKQQHPDLDVYLGGTAAFDHGLLTEFYHFSLLTFPLAVFLVSFIVAWIFSPYILVAGLTACGLTIAATAGIFGWLPVTLDQTAVMGTLLVFILTVVDCMHFGGTYMVEIAKSTPKEEAIKEAIRVNLAPIFFTTLTTSVGLITLLVTGSPPFVLFAKIALVGITIGYFSSIIIPTMFLQWAGPQAQSKISPIPPLVSFTKRIVARRPKQILAVFTAFILLSAALIPLNKVDEDIHNYFMADTDLDKAIETIQDDFTSDNQLTIDVMSRDGQSINSPAMFLAIEQFEHWIKLKPFVVSTFTINDIIRETKGVWDNQSNSTKLPQTREEYSQLLTVFELSLLAGQSSSEFISQDRSQTLLTVFMEDRSNQALLLLQDEIQLWWDQQNIEIKISGRDIIFAELSEKTVYGSMIGAGIAMLLITLFMILAFRSVKWGLFSLIPNVTPFLFLFGLWALLYGEINQATCMAFSIVLGIVMDDSIHYIMKFRDAKSTMSTEDAINKTFDYVGWAISATSLSFIATGVILFSTSTFVPNAILGAFLVVCLFFAWLSDMFFLPALLAVYYGRKESKLSSKNPAERIKSLAPSTKERAA